jgi:hypothetical protein
MAVTIQPRSSEPSATLRALGGFRRISLGWSQLIGSAASPRATTRPRSRPGRRAWDPMGLGGGIFDAPADFIGPDDAIEYAVSDSGSDGIAEAEAEGVEEGEWPVDEETEGSATEEEVRLRLASKYASVVDWPAGSLNVAGSNRNVVPEVERDPAFGKKMAFDFLQTPRPWVEPALTIPPSVGETMMMGAGVYPSGVTGGAVIPGEDVEDIKDLSE